jgi:hypothetical protein
MPVYCRARGQHELRERPATAAGAAGVTGGAGIDSSFVCLRRRRTPCAAPALTGDRMMQQDPPGGGHHLLVTRTRRYRKHLSSAIEPTVDSRSSISSQACRTAGRAQSFLFFGSGLRPRQEATSFTHERVDWGLAATTGAASPLLRPARDPSRHGFDYLARPLNSQVHLGGWLVAPTLASCRRQPR